MILGIETATQVCAVALAKGDDLFAEYRLNRKNAHARWLAGGVERVMSDTGFSFADLQAVAVSIGPGSFTGLRIGLAFAKGVAFSHNLPMVAVPTLSALASQAPLADGLVCAALPSRRHEFYRAFFEIKHYLAHPLGEIEMVSTDALVASLPEGCLLLTEPNNELAVKAMKVPAHFIHLSAYTIARLGAQRFAEGLIENSDTLEPTYLQEFITGPVKGDVNTSPQPVK